MVKDNKTRYEKAFDAGGQSALVEAALEDQSALAELVNRKQRELEKVLTQLEDERSQRDEAGVMLDRIRELITGEAS